jgi:ABC-2 type transport system ATP-binding protein
MTALQVRGLAHRYHDTVVLHGVDLTVPGGEVHALLGFNGAGKSTLMRAVLGMIRPQGGVVFIDGVEVAHLDGAGWGRVGHLIDTPFLYPELTVLENLWAAARLHGVPASAAGERAARTLADLGLGPWADRRASALSQGNRQRVGLGSALVHEPRLLVLDEPTNALDPAGVLLLREQLLARAAAGVAVLVSSHHLDEVARIAHRVSVMHAGTIVGELDPHGLDLERGFFAMVHAADEAARGAEPVR